MTAHLLGLDLAEAVRRYQAGESMHAIAEDMGASRSTLWERLNALGISRHRMVTPRPPLSRLYCQRGHEHVMTPEQAERLSGSACCWCCLPIGILEAITSAARSSLGNRDSEHDTFAQYWNDIRNGEVPHA